MAVKLADNVAQRYVFEYDNCIRMESQAQGKKIPGKWYYSFGKGETRLNATSELCAAIAQNWPGRGGEVEIIRRNAHHFEVTIVTPGSMDNNGIPYPLTMKVWGEGKPYPEDVEFEILGLEANGTQGEPAGDPPPPNDEEDAPPKPSEEESPSSLLHSLQPAVPERSMGDSAEEVDAQWIEKSNRMSSCLSMARQALQTSGFNADEEVEATQKLAVTLYLDSKGLAPLSMFQVYPNGGTPEDLTGGATAPANGDRNFPEA